MPDLSASLDPPASHSETANEAANKAGSAQPDFTASASAESTAAPTAQVGLPSALAALPSTNGRSSRTVISPPKGKKDAAPPVFSERPEQDPGLRATVERLLLKDTSLPVENTIDINGDFLAKAWSAARSQKPDNTREFAKWAHHNYKKLDQAAGAEREKAAKDHFQDSMTNAVHAGGYADWNKPSGGGVPTVFPANPSKWQHATNAKDSQLTSTRLADFILSKDTDLRKAGKELQAVASTEQRKIVMSMNNDGANILLRERYPSADVLKNELGKFIADSLKTSAPNGSSKKRNEDDRLRRATELFHWLDKNPGVVLEVVPNPDNRHAEIAIRSELTTQQDQGMIDEGKAAGSKPPCTGCVLWFNEQGAINEYKEVDGVQAGPLFLTPNSGMRTQFEQADVTPVSEKKLTATDVTKVASTLATQFKNLQITLLPVTSDDVTNIPRSPDIDDPSTPDYNKAFNFGMQLRDN